MQFPPQKSTLNTRQKKFFKYLKNTLKRVNVDRNLRKFYSEKSVTTST